MFVSSEQDKSVEQASSDQANSLTTTSHKELQELRSLLGSMKKQKITTWIRTWKYC